MSRTLQQLADELNSLHAQAINIVEGTIAGAALPGGSISFTYRNPIDGQTYTATGTAWNTCSPSKVSALKLKDGTWIVIGAHESATVRSAVHTDRRARPREQAFGKIQVLFSTIEGSNRVFYVGGDRTVPKRIHAIPATKFVGSAKISNTGASDRYSVGLKYSDEINQSYTYESTKITFSGQQRWAVDYTVPSEELRQIYTDPAFMGHNFWTQTVPTANSVGARGTNAPLTSFSQFLGTKRIIARGSTYFNPNAQSYTLSQGSSAFNAIAPNVDKFSRSDYYNPGFASDFKPPIALGKSAATAIYEHYIDDDHVFPGVLLDDLFLVDCGTKLETKLGGDMDWRDDRCNSLNLIGRQIYELNLGDAVYLAPTQRTLQIPESAWKPTQSKNLTIDIYSLGTNTTKRSLTARVQAIKPNAQIHSLSYHP
jgi:hypothetical protein